MHSRFYYFYNYLLNKHVISNQNIIIYNSDKIVRGPDRSWVAKGGLSRHSDAIKLFKLELELEETMDSKYRAKKQPSQW